MVWQFVEVFKRVSLSARVKDDDFSDRLNHTWTVAFLLLFCILVGSSQYVGSPIACWVPAHYTGAMTTYANYICWISNTYYVPTSESLLKPGESRANRQINYYQWVPFILAFMSLLFYIPFLIWHLFSKPVGLDSKSLMKIISSMDATSVESREKALSSAVNLMDRAITYERNYNYNFFQRCVRQLKRCLLPALRSGNYISILYILIKVLYLANVFIQFVILNAFMGHSFHEFGHEVVQKLYKGETFWESKRFPRVSICEFTIRTLGEHNHNNTVQCVLPINLFNEKIFIFVWFWLVFLIIVNFYSLVCWSFTFMGFSRSSFIKRYIETNYRQSHSHLFDESISNLIDSKLLNAFLFEYLRADGVFLLRLVKKNTNDIVTGELVYALWEKFKNNPKFSRHNGREDEENRELKNDVC